MMVKSGKRGFSARALYRLEQVESEIAERKGKAARIVDGLLAGEGTALELVEREFKNRGKKTLHVEYSDARAANSLPKELTLRKPSDEHCAQVSRIFGQTLNVTVVALACLPKNLRGEKYLSSLTPDSRIRLNNAALSLVIPDWKSLAAAGTHAPAKSIGRGGEVAMAKSAGPRRG